MSSFKVTAGRDGSRRTFGEHDDRDRYDIRGGGDSGSGGGSRRGQNRRRNGRGAIYKRGRGLNPRSRLDDDIDMGGYDAPHKQRDRYYPYRKQQPAYVRNLAMDREVHSALGWQSDGSRGGGRGGQGGRGNNRRGRPTYHQGTFEVPRSRSGWYKITIPYAHKVDKKTLLQLLNSALNVPFVPIGFYLEGTSGVFFVNDYDSAKALSAISRQVILPNGSKVVISVRPDANPPATSINDSVKEVLKTVMSDRYDPSTRSMNLSNLYNDNTLNTNDIRLVLNRRTVMQAVLSIVHENIPELVSLDLSNNRLQALDSMTDIATKAPNLVKLDLSKNNLNYITELSKIKELKLVALQLEGNALCDHFEDENSYVSAVRKRFAKIINLDGHDLPPPVTFDVEENTALPPSKGSFFTNEEVQKQVCTFIEQYITIYDSSDRQPILDAYHDNAVFSMTACINKLLSERQNIGSYLDKSRNLNRVHDNVRRHKLLKTGRVNIVSAMNELPASEHDLASFVVDVGLATPDLMSFTLRGLFRETSTKTDIPPIRYFSRTFITVPRGPGIVIINEQYTIMPASQKQVAEAFRTLAPTPSSSPVVTAGSAVNNVLTPEIKKAMVTQFCVQSHMNQAFSERCLEENSWDYEAAARVFLDLQTKGSIPPEAFQ